MLCLLEVKNSSKKKSSFLTFSIFCAVNTYNYLHFAVSNTQYPILQKKKTDFLNRVFNTKNN